MKRILFTIIILGGGTFFIWYQRNTLDYVVPPHAQTPLNSAINQDLPTQKIVANLSDSYLRFQTGDFEGAVALLRSQLRQTPRDEIVKANLIVALKSLALLRVQEKRLAEAEELFEEAAQLGDIESHRAAAALKMRQGRVDLAIETFEKVFDGHKDVLALKALIDLSLRTDNMERAENYLNKFEALQDADKDFLKSRQQRLSQRRIFSRTQDFLDSGNVQIAYSDPSAKNAAASVAGAMEKVLGELSVLMGPLPQGQKIKAWLLPSTSFQAYTGAPTWAGALFDGFIRFQIPQGSPSQATLSRLSKDARHETTHAYLYAFCGDTIPSWLGEGLAQHFEGYPVTSSLQTIRALRAEASPPLDDYFIGYNTSQVNVLYARSRLLVEELLADKGMNGFKDVFKFSCLEKGNLGLSLENNFGANTAETLWKKYAPLASSRERSEN